MLPTFVIGLREGLEAALVVGIIAAFLRKQGRRDLLRWVFVGVTVAVLLCAAAGVALNVLSRELPQRQQEGLETVIGALAVVMVTYMVVWMKRNSRGLKGQLEGLAADAMGAASGAARAMILMAFLAVLREGVETVVFLLAAFQSSTSGAGAAAGAIIGITVAVLLGYGIYRGGVHINLSKFFRATGLVLVLVAAGIVVNALHTAHEAGWLDVGQSATFDLTWLVRPGSVQASLLTGMLGLQGRPVLIEVIGWLVYLVPVGAFVAWPPGRTAGRRVVAAVLGAVAALLFVAAGVVALVRPAAPRPPAASGGYAIVSRSGAAITVRGPSGSQTLSRAGVDEVAGVPVDRYRASRATVPPAGLPARLTAERAAQLNGGRLPIGVRPSAGTVAVRYVDSVVTTASVEPRTGRLISYRSVDTTTASVIGAGGNPLALTQPVRSTTSGDIAAQRGSVAAARQDLHALDRRSAFAAVAWTLLVVGLVAVLAAGAAVIGARRHAVETTVTPAGEFARN